MCKKAICGPCVVPLISILFVYKNVYACYKMNSTTRPLELIVPLLYGIYNHFLISKMYRVILCQVSRKSVEQRNQNVLQHFFNLKSAKMVLHWAPQNDELKWFQKDDAEKSYPCCLERGHSYNITFDVTFGAKHSTSRLLGSLIKSKIQVTASHFTYKI